MPRRQIFAEAIDTVIPDFISRVVVMMVLELNSRNGDILS